MNNTDFKLDCLYYAKTELYDRSLTDERCQYDDTEAYIYGEKRSLSNRYAIYVRDSIKKYYPKWNPCAKNCFRAQYWVDVYCYLKEEIKDEEFLQIIETVFRK